MKLPADLAHADLSTLSQALSDGAVTARDLTELYLDRIARHNAALNALIHVDAEAARAEADAADALRRAGAVAGPLHGIPIAVKDLCDVAGQPGTGGSLALKDRRPAQTATVVKRLRAAGMVLIGRAHMVEFACGGWGTNQYLGTPRNPWDREVHRVPGGSSSGSGVTVAAALAPAAIGSDTSGSIRIPAALCGLTGLKPTHGRVSNANTMPLAHNQDSLGPMVRTAQDAALIHAVIAGPDPLDPATLGLPPAADVLDGIGLGIAGRRFGVLPDAHLDGVAEGVLAAYRAALTALEKQGASIHEITPPERCEDVQPRSFLTIMSEGYSNLRHLLEDERLPIGQHTKQRILTGKPLLAADYIALLQDRIDSSRRWQASIDGMDALLTPTLPISAIPVEEVDEASLILGRFTRMVSYFGWCALSVPAGLDGAGLPVSLQIVCRPHGDALALRIGHAFQSATDWHRQTAPGWG
ncbi:MAG: amidase [Oceanibaculum nanhaiense]|jgi:aspartyl-tRNA(Asn)/glutamyl-tRNA(Gln) amidotransferase subunit A|uniref:amidase n=1 Tax=Oceanibaculum nanhaiense TaxID=1909734 RepID=UPI0032EAD810